MEAIAATALEREPTSLSVFLSGLPGSWEVQLFYGLMLSGTVGMIAHYLLKWARDEIRGNLFAYLRTNIKCTSLSFFTFVGVAAGFIASNAFVGEFGGFVGWKMVFWTGFMNGFGIDAIVNKTGRVSWSDYERHLKAANGRLGPKSGEQDEHR